MGIRLGNKDDIKGIIDVNVKTWLTTYRGIVPDKVLDGLNTHDEERVSRMEKAFEEKSMESLIYEEDGHVVGFATYGSQRDNELDYDGEVYAVYVLKEYQGKSIGKKLIKEVVKRLLNKGKIKLVIWTLEENKGRVFYEKLGGRVIKKKTIEIGGKELVEVAYGWNLRESSIL